MTKKILNLLDEDDVLLLELVEGDPHGSPDHMGQPAEGQRLLGSVDHDVHTPVPLVEGSPDQLQHAAIVPDQAVYHLIMITIFNCANNQHHNTDSTTTII